MADNRIVLSDEEFNNLPDAPITLTDEAFNALPDAGANDTTPQERRPGFWESFSEGVSRSLGGRYVVPAIASLITGDKYSDIQKWYDARADKIKRNSPIASTSGELAGMMIGLKGAGALAGAAAKGTKVASLAGRASALAESPVLSKLAGSALVKSAASGAAAAALAEPYMTVMSEGRLPTLSEETRAVTTGAALAPTIYGLSSLGAKLASPIMKHIGKAYKNPTVSSSYGRATDTPINFKSDYDVALAVKKGVKRTDGSQFKTLKKAIRSEDADKPFMTTGSDKQMAISEGLVDAMRDANADVAASFGRRALAPRARAAASSVNSVVDDITVGRPGSPADFAARSDVLNQLYDTGINKLANMSFSSNEVKQALLRKGINETTADNILKQVALVKTANPFTSGASGVATTGEVADIPAKTLARYVRNLASKKDALMFAESDNAVKALSELLAARGAPEYVQGAAGWRKAFALREAYDQGRAAASLPTVTDVRGALKANPQSGLSAVEETAAKRAGFFSKVVDESVNNMAQINLRRATAPVVSADIGLKNAIRDYNHWQTMFERSQGPLNFNMRPVSDVVKTISKLGWSGRAATARGIEAGLQNIARKAGVQTAESIERLLTSPGSDFIKVLNNTTYRSIPSISRPVGRTVPFLIERDNNE